ncbi:MAG: hypothetical protein BGP03_05630 [Pseudonocardia sp. 73-21]|nr:MAG: hypothetical protein BGP03_05630 [Pseudonocardia sp. 73-21]
MVVGRPCCHPAGESAEQFARPAGGGAGLKMVLHNLHGGGSQQKGVQPISGRDTGRQLGRYLVEPQEKIRQSRSGR